MNWSELYYRLVYHKTVSSPPSLGLTSRKDIIRLSRAVRLGGHAGHRRIKEWTFQGFPPSPLTTYMLSYAHYCLLPYFSRNIAIDVK